MALLALHAADALAQTPPRNPFNVGVTEGGRPFAENGMGAGVASSANDEDDSPSNPASSTTRARRDPRSR